MSTASALPPIAVDFAPAPGTLVKYYAADEINFVPGERCFFAWVSTDVVDHEGDVIDARGIDFTSVYLGDGEGEKGNPCVLAVHDTGKWPIGQCKWLKVRTTRGWTGLYGKVVIDDTDDTEIVWKKIQSRTLRGVSIRVAPPPDLKPGEWSPPSKDELKAHPHWAGAKRVIRRSVMIELSVCPLGMNPTALIEAVSKGMHPPVYAAKAEGGRTVPYELARRKKNGRVGYAVRNADTGRVYSDEPLSHDDALAQLRAIEIHTHGKSETEAPEVPEAGQREGVHKPPFTEHKDVMDEWEVDEEEGSEGGGRKAMAPPDDPDEDEDDGDEGPVRKGHFVRAVKGPYKGTHGKVASVHRSGPVPDVDEDVIGTKDNPGLRVKAYKAMGDGHREMDHHFGCRTSHVEKVDDLRPPSRRKGLPDPLSLPPLRGKTDAEVKAERFDRVKAALSGGGVDRLITRAIERRNGAV